MEGRIHRLVVYYEGEEYTWGVDEDYTNYMALCTDICQDVLGDEYGIRTVSLNISGRVKGYANSFIVNNDKSWMALLGKNVRNKEYLIHLYVKIDEVITTEASPPRVHVGSHKCSITELDDDNDHEENALVPFLGHEVPTVPAISVMPKSYNDSFVSIFV